MGTYRTIRSEQIMQSVIVVVNEKPVGSKGRNLNRELRRNTRNPELRSGIFRRDKKFANLFSMNLAGRRIKGTFVIRASRAATTISAWSAASSISGRLLAGYVPSASIIATYVDVPALMPILSAAP